MQDEITDDQMSEGIGFFESVEPEVVEEVTPEPEPPVITKEQYDAAIADKVRLEKELSDRNEPGYKDLRSKYDTVTDRHAKVIKAVKDNGLGDFDQDTGVIVLYKDKPAPPEPEADPIQAISEQIADDTELLEQQYSDGDITDAEYRQGKTAIDDLREERTLLKLKKGAVPVAPVVKEPEPKPDTVPVVSEDTEISKGFYDLATQYPESTDSKSLLFKKMSEIYENDSRYKAANPGEVVNGEVTKWTGSPAVRELLIERAAQELETEGKAKKDQFKATVKNSFTAPDSGGYEPPAVTNKLTEHQTRIITSIAGTRNKAAIDDITAKMNEFDTNLSVTFD